MRHYLARAAALAIIVSATALSACGTKGPLTHPLKPSAQPSPTPLTNDLNTAKDPAR